MSVLVHEYTQTRGQCVTAGETAIHTMKRHFVKFLGRGSFVAEEKVLPIDSWDVNKAVEMASDITLPYNQRPYGFHFITRERGENDLDSKVTATSGFYYIGGVVMDADQVKAMIPDSTILLSNMRINNWDRVIAAGPNRSWVQPLRSSDTVLDVTL